MIISHARLATTRRRCRRLFGFDLSASVHDPAIAPPHDPVARSRHHGTGLAVTALPVPPRDGTDLAVTATSVPPRDGMTSCSGPVRSVFGLCSVAETPLRGPGATGVRGRAYPIARNHLSTYFSGPCCAEIAKLGPQNELHGPREADMHINQRIASMYGPVHPMAV